MDYMIGRCRFCGSERDVLADDQECARDNYSRTRTTDCCEKHKREKSEEGELIHCREWTKCPDYVKENTDESI